MIDECDFNSKAT